MKHVMERARSRIAAFGAALALLTAGLAVAATAPAQAEADGYEGLLTDHVVEIHETVSDAGFVHPGVGLSAENLRNAQAMVRSGQEPWASYFQALTQAQPWASPTYTVNNMVRGQPDVPVTNTFTQGGMRGRLTNDSFGVLTQALLWVTTGDEAYRRNAIMGLRTWSNMNPDGYAYFPDAHIHTGKPLSQFLMAAEIIRATDPVDDDTPGSYDGYDVAWHAEDDEKLLGNLAEPIVNVFNYSNEKWMNQHNFGLYGRIATAIYADDAEGYARGIEWFTMNSTFDDYINGSLGEQIQHIPADDPLNPYGYGFTQLREMGRDQAHAETNIDNFAALARFLDVQGTEVDPVDGTVSTSDDAVSAYRFLDNRLLEGADAFYGFMMGAWTPWIDEREWGGNISQAYRGRIFNSLSELYYQYTYREGVDVEAEAPWLAELHERMDGPFFRYGTGTNNFWGPGDKSVEYWVAFPPELAGTEPTPTEDTEVTFGRYALPLDDGTETVTEDGRTFARATADADGTTSVVSRLMYPGGTRMGVLVRTDGPATLEVLDKEEPNRLNPDETSPGIMDTIELADTQGEWRYVTYPAAGPNTHFYRVSGTGTTVDLDTVMFDAGAQLTPPVFEQTYNRYYLREGVETTLDFHAADAGGSVAYSANGLAEGASLDPETGAFTWEPGRGDLGSHSVQIVADDGESVAAQTFELAVAPNREEQIEKLLDDTVDEDTVYTTVTYEPYQAALAEARALAGDGTDEEFDAAFADLRTAIDALKELNPSLADGSLDHRGIVVPHQVSEAGANALADGHNHSHTGDLRVGSLVLDFGTQYRVAAEQFGIQARFSFPMRSQGTNVYGSNDGSTWTLLSKRMSGDTNDMEIIDVVDDQQGEKFRYFKLQLDEPAPPIDPAYPGIWSVAEFHIFGERSEVPGTVTDVSLSSPDALRERVTDGDTVDLAFASPTPVSDVAVTIGGQTVEATSDDNLSWTASTELGEVTGGGTVPIAVDHTTEDGVEAETILGTTDGTQLYASDERNLVDLADAEVIKADGSPDPSGASQSAAMLDGNASTFSNIPTVDGEAHLIWDFGEGGQVIVDRLDYLARQDDEGARQMDGLVFEGSNDLSSWTTLTEPTFKTLSWQNLPSSEDEGFRYLRVKNAMLIHIAELRLFGDYSVDLDAVIARAEAVDLSPYSRASAILFTRELQAVKAAAGEAGADRDALSERLLQAWNLLEDPPSTTMPVERSWVTASSRSWDGSLDAAANGWAMFDGDPSTATDTTSATGWVQVVPDDGRVLTVETVRVWPRSGNANRANGFQFQGSNDGGATWETFATIGMIPPSGWTEIPLAEPVSYGALRLYSPNGYTNLAELQFVRVPVDATGLDLYLEETGELSEADWTAGSWADLTEARESGLALRETGANPTQAEVDAATDAIAAAVAALVATE
jgi:putative Ig domain-containing protein